MGIRKRRSGCLSAVIGLSAIVCIVVLAASGGFLGKGVKKGLAEGVAKGIGNTKQIPFQEISITDEELAQKYYYQQLDEDERTAYKEIAQGAKLNVEEIYVHAADADRTNAIFQYVLKDFPEIFWCDGTTKSTSYEGQETYTVLQPVYSYTEDEKAQKKAEIEKAVNDCLSGIGEDAADYDKILYVYEYIVDTVDYDIASEDNQNIYSVFVNKRSVCAGYSKATQYLLERLGVFCTYVTGTTSGGQSHAWNLVKCEGDYYYVDTTWGDPVFQAPEGGEIDPSYISYDYMCCDDEELKKTHAPDTEVPLPECVKMDFNYYAVNDMYYTSYDGEQALSAMNDVIAAKANPVVFKFADSRLYEQAREDIFGSQIKRAAQNMADWYGLSEVKYKYMDEAELNKITIYWQYE